MLGVTLRVAMPGADVVEVDVTPRVVVDFERQFDVGFLDAIANQQRLEHVYFLGWDCLRLAGVDVQPFEEWLDEVLTVEIALDD
jgi:hypothetical protein